MTYINDAQPGCRGPRAAPQLSLCESREQIQYYFIYVEEYSLLYCKVRRVPDVSEEHIASIIRVKERGQ
jgi:hypothetical protein